ncbi:hypothetical protein [Vibrio sp. D431a]|uniref:hypothetical protein n=1 Tax=Vibrio sp. D431a TaxID=2837388 RepID=UPI002555106D|nr:hypothetical protein [Vibrio sp. D431a]MDK9790654.1 hypothetical protein [Vibrio sp. D431a]
MDHILNTEKHIHSIKGLENFDILKEVKISQLSLPAYLKKKWVITNECTSLRDAVRKIETNNLKSLERFEVTKVSKIAEELSSRLQEIYPLIEDESYSIARSLLKDAPVSDLKLTRRVEEVLFENGVSNALDAAIFIFKEHLMNRKGVGTKNSNKARLQCIEMIEHFNKIEQPKDVSKNTFSDTLHYVLKNFELLTSVNVEKLQHIINRRFGFDGYEAEPRLEVAKHIGISHQRVKQLESRIFELIENFFSGKCVNNHFVNEEQVKHFEWVSTRIKAKGYILTRSEATRIIFSGEVDHNDKPEIKVLMESFGYFDVGIESIKHFKERLYAKKGKANSVQIKDVARLARQELTCAKEHNLKELATKVHKAFLKSTPSSSLDVSEVTKIISHGKFCNVTGGIIKAKMWHLTALEVAHEVLRTHGSPMNLRELRDKVNELRNDDLAGCDKNKLTVQNIGNISSDKRFKASKHGMWMLSEWEEYTTEPLIETMKRICALQKGRIQKESLIDLISLERPEYSKQTIAVYIPKVSGLTISRATKHRPSFVTFDSKMAQ